MHLLVMSCSASKVDSSTPMPAFDLYSGVFFSMLKKHLTLYPDMIKYMKVIIISAKYGLIEADDLITTYDLKMTKQIAIEQYDRNTELLYTIVKKYSPKSMTIVMGQTYRKSANFSSAGLPTTVISGPIGVMLHNFRNWLINQQMGEKNAC